MTTKERPATALRKLFLRRSVPYGLLALACGLSIAASWYVASTAAATAEAQTRLEFVGDAQQVRRQLQAGLNTYIEVVRAGAVLLSADNEINGSEFRRFVDGLELPERYPGMEGIGFAQCVLRQDLGRFLRLIDLDGDAIHLWPEAERGEYCPTIFLEPTSARNKQALGFDLASNGLLQEALATARDAAEPTASRNLTDLPVWNNGWRGNIVLFIPVYRFAAPLGTVESRRRALVGFVFSPLDTDRLLRSIVSATMPRVAIDVHDGAAKDANNLLGRWNAAASTGPYASSEQVEVSGRSWLVTVKSIAKPVSIVTPAARQTLFGGLILSFMLFLVTRAQVRAWETAARHEQELRASEHALRESEAQAQSANRTKDEFLATVSHELRTPLNVVLGWVSMLRLEAVRGERLAHGLDIIERNARQQAELIDDLLDVSRIVTGKMRLELRPQAFAPLVSGAVESLRPSADAKGVGLTASLDEEATIRADPDRLQQIARNLIANAIKFTPTGGRVTVTLTHEKRHVTLTVSDTGIGIAPEFLPHVFERFRQADSSTTRTHSGVGLGLAIARNLVELHGGTIRARSEGTGRGATFIVRLPAVPSPASATFTLPVVASAPVPGPRLDGVRVLVVDDEPNTRELLTEALGTSGARVTVADSARYAFERLRAEGADVIVSDIAMPDEDGLSLMQRIRALPGDVGRTPAIALTALARREDRARAIQAGYQMHIAKPVQLVELQAAVASLVPRRSDQRATGTSA